MNITTTFFRHFSTQEKKSSILKFLSLWSMVLLLGIGGVKGQVSLTASGSPVTIDFSTAVSGVCSSNVVSTATSAMMAATPAVGQLDADAWAFVTDGATTGGAASFPGSLNANFNTITAAGNNSTGWGMSNISSDRELAIFPSGTQATAGSITLLITNNTGSTLNELSISYNVRAYNDQARSNKVEFWYSATNAANSYTENTAAEFTSTAVASTSFESASRTVNLTSLSIANNGSYYIRWFLDDVGGSGSRDEFFLDDIVITGTASTSPTIIATGSLTPFISSGISSPSAEQTFTVAGTTLTHDIVITPPTGYQVSTTSGSGFGSPVTLIQAGGTVATTTIYARFNPTALADQVGGNIACTSTGATTQNVAVTGEVTNLSAGALAFIAFQGSTPDIFRMVALEDITEGTRVQLTDKSWDGSAVPPAFTATENTGVWTAPVGGVTRGTVIAFDADAGTVSVGTGGIQSGLGSAGEQLFAYQGTLTTPTFIAGFTSGSTIASGVPTGIQTWVPAGLTDGTNYLALGNNAGASSLNVATNNRTVADHRSFIHNSTNWTTATSGTWPAWTFTFLANEPTTQPSFTAATSVGNNEMTLNFSGGDGTSYMVVMRQGSAVSATPSDATNYSAVSGSVNFTTATELSAGQRIVYNGTIAGTTVTVTNLSPGTTYHYAIYAYNGTGTLTNFNTTSPGTGNETTTGSSNSSSSDIIIHASFTEPSNIAYAANQENTNLTDVNSIEVARFTLRDGAGAGDADANPSTLNAITFAITNHAVLRRLALYNGTTELGEIAVSTGTATFSGLTLSAADDASQDFSLRASFAGTVTDNTQFSFTVSSATADPAGSNFADADAGAAVSSTTGDRNRIEVTATLLAFVQQPSNVSINTTMTPAPTVSANDALGNRDLDYTTDMTASTTGTFGTSTNPVTPVDGLGTFSNLQFSAAATGRTIAITSGSLTASGNSNTFDVTSLIMPGDIAIISYQSDNPDGFTIITFVDIPANQTFYFTDNQWTTAVGPLATNENTMTWTTPANVIPAGTAIFFSNTSGSTTTITPIGNGTASSALSGLAAAGDQIFMYRGASGNPTAFICALNFGNSGAWQTSAGLSNNSSFLPADLTNNVNAVSFSSLQENGYFGGTQSGSIATIKALVNNGANWIRSNSIQTHPTWSYTINANTTTISANTTVQNLDLANGETFVIGANTLTINGSVSGAGTLTGGNTSNLTIGGAAGTIAFTGGSRTLNNLIIGTGANASLTLGSALDIAPAGSITFNAAGTKSLTINSQTLTLKSDAAGTASIGNTNSATITGNITTERYIPAARKFRFLASPVVGATAAHWRDNVGSNPGIGMHITGTGGAANNFDVSTTNAPSAFTYTEANGENTNTTIGGADNAGWTAFTSGTQSLTNGQGFRVLVRGDRSISLTATPAPAANNTTLSVTGTYPTSPVVINVTRAADVAGKGWSLVGNPYPATISWNAITKSAEMTGTYQTFNPTTNAYVSYNGTTGDATDNISSGQGFLVFVTNGSNFTTGSITIEEADKVSANGGSFFKTSLKNHLKVTMKYDSNNVNNAFIHFRENANELFDAAFDAPKLTNPGVNISTKDLSGNNYSINSLPLNGLDAERVIPVSVLNSVQANYTLEFNDVNSFEKSEVYLEDTYTKTTHKLSDGFKYAISLTSDKASSADGRFNLVFKPTATGLEIAENNQLFNLYPNPAQNEINLSVAGRLKGEFKYEIINQLGAVIQTNALNFNSSTIQAINIEGLNQGVYFMRVFNNNSNQTIKFIK